MSKGLLVVCLGACSPGCLTAGGKAPSGGDAQNGGSAPWGLKTRRRHTNSFRVQPGCLSVRPARSPHLSESTRPPGPCSTEHLLGGPAPDQAATWPALVGLPSSWTRGQRCIKTGRPRDTGSQSKRLTQIQTWKDGESLRDAQTRC